MNSFQQIQNKSLSLIVAGACGAASPIPARRLPLTRREAARGIAGEMRNIP
ncbi:MAG: hypothetical protein KAF91_16420 [Nostoc sp. TH1S01]|nr:hypothetical protein [Nostoc sp. TH1S01]